MTQTYLVVVSNVTSVVTSSETNQTMLEVTGLQPGVLHNVTVTPCACGRQGTGLQISVRTGKKCTKRKLIIPVPLAFGCLFLPRRVDTTVDEDTVWWEFITYSKLLLLHTITVSIKKYNNILFYVNISFEISGLIWTWQNARNIYFNWLFRVFTLTYPDFFKYYNTQHWILPLGSDKNV